MFAIVKIKGKQYRVQAGALVDVDLMDADPASEIEFDEVLLVSQEGEEEEAQAQIGAPFLKDFRVKAEVVETVYGPKVEAYKFKRRKNYHRSKGHRQRYTRLKVKEIAQVA